MSLGLRGHGRGPVGSLWERSGISARDAGGQLAEGQPWTERQLGTLNPLLFQVGKLRLWTGEVAPLKSWEPGPRLRVLPPQPRLLPGLATGRVCDTEAAWLWLRMAFFVHSVIHSLTDVERACHEPETVLDTGSSLEQDRQQSSPPGPEVFLRGVTNKR